LIACISTNAATVTRTAHQFTLPLKRAPRAEMTVSGMLADASFTPSRYLS
jgi:hypothetical protein